MYDESRNYVLSATHAAAYQITRDICVLCYDSVIALAVHRGLELKNGCCMAASKLYFIDTAFSVIVPLFPGK